MPLDPSKLKAAREKRGLTQTQLADLANVHRVTIARLESGTRSNPPVDDIASVAALKCKIETLLLATS